MAPWPQLTTDSNSYLRDGKPHQIISGSICYFRIMPDQWADRLAKLVALGANAVEIYIPWNFHEPSPGVWDFSGPADVAAFVRLAAEAGLDVLLRPGPFICAEWCMGGLPWWLLAEDPVPKFRCSDPAFLKPVERYFRQVLGDSVLGPLMRSRGGPIVAMQIENEYGYWGSDEAYLEWLSALVSELAGRDVLQFTVDGCYTPETQQLGGFKGALRTASFGSRPQQRFRSLSAVQPSGPLTVMEFWVGWFTTWGGGAKATRSAESAASELAEILAMGASVNIFVFAGGTSFGFWAGANLDRTTDRLEPHITSYDYDGLLSEDGALTEKFHACRKVIAAHSGDGPLSGPVPWSLAEPPATLASRSVDLLEAVSLLDALPAFGHPSTSSGNSQPAPQAIERLGEGLGYVLYRFTGGERTLRALEGLPLKIYGARDFALVLTDGKPLATWDRSDEPSQVVLTPGITQLDILVEVTARVNFGPGMAERKGIDGSVRAGIRPHDERELFGWQSLALPMKPEQLAGLPWRSFPTGAPLQGPHFFRGEFQLADGEAPADTWLRVVGFTRGFVALNGFVLGWHRQEGPQLTLYAPKSLLKRGRNEIVVFEMLGEFGAKARPMAVLEGAPCWSSSRARALKLQVREVTGFLQQVGPRQLWRMARHELASRPAAL